MKRGTEYRCHICKCSYKDSAVQVEVTSTGVMRFRCRCDPPLVHRFENGEWRFYSKGHLEYEGRIAWPPQEEKDGTELA